MKKGWCRERKLGKRAEKSYPEEWVTFPRRWVGVLWGRDSSCSWVKGAVSVGARLCRFTREKVRELLILLSAGRQACYFIRKAGLRLRKNRVYPHSGSWEYYWTLMVMIKLWGAGIVGNDHWPRSLWPSTQETEAGRSAHLRQPGLHSEFNGSFCYRVRTPLS